MEESWDTQVHAEYCHLITRVFNRAEVFVAEFKPTFSPVDKASKDLRHNPSEARIPMSAADGDAVAIKDSVTASTPELD